MMEGKEKVSRKKAITERESGRERRRREGVGGINEHKGGGGQMKGEAD